MWTLTENYSSSRHYLYLPGFIALAAATYILSMIPLKIRAALDLIQTEGIQQDDVRAAVAVIIIFATLVALVGSAARILMLVPARQWEFNVRHHLFESVSRIPGGKDKNGDLIVPITEDTRNGAALLGSGLFQLCNIALIYVFSTYQMMTLNINLALLIISPLPLILLFIGLMTRSFTSILSRKRNILTEMAEIGLKKEQPSNQEIPDQFKKINSAYGETSAAMAKLRAVIYPAALIFGILGYIILLTVGGKMAMAETVSIGEVVAFASYITFISWATLSIPWTITLIKKGRIAVKAIRSHITGLSPAGVEYNIPRPAAQTEKKPENTFSEKMETVAGKKTEVSVEKNIRFDFEKDIYFLGRYWRYFKIYRTPVTIAILLIPVISLLQLTLPILLKQAIDNGIIGQNLSSLYLTAIFFSICAVFMLIARSIQSFIFQYIGRNTTGAVRTSLLHHAAPLAAEETVTGNLTTALISDSESLHDCFAGGQAQLFTDMITMGGSIIVMFFLNTRLTLMLLLILIPVVILVNSVRRKIRFNMDTAHGANDRMTALITSRFSQKYNEKKGKNMANASFYGKNHSQEDFRNANTRYSTRLATSLNDESLLYFSLEATRIILIGIAIWYGWAHYHEGVFTIGLIAAFIEYIRYLFVPLRELSGQCVMLQNALISLEKILAAINRNRAANCQA